MNAHLSLIEEKLCSGYAGMFREPGGALKHPFLTPGSENYADILWDWDSWFSDVALRQILIKTGGPGEREQARPYERGCVLNFLEYGGLDGWVPFIVGRDGPFRSEHIYEENMHKPCLAQHAAFLVQADGDAEWLRPKFYHLQSFLNNYRNHHRHACGLYFWQNDRAIGVDNDPCTYYRPKRSSGSIYLNCLMLVELRAMEFLCEKLGLEEVGRHYAADARALLAAVREHCWDERDGFYYSVDLNLLPVEARSDFGLHQGMPRDWPCLIQRIGVWSGFLALWAGIATPEQAARIVAEHFHNPKTFNAPFGIRTLSRMEKMYNLRGTGNPSSWLGPVWGIANYMVWRGLVNYGFSSEATELAEKTVRLFGHDLERFGVLHEYYQPENGEPILNPGFQNWNYLVLNMAEWLQGREPVAEFGMGRSPQTAGVGI
ncbi:MAG: glycoside hydrolase family 37 [Chthoniobacterales bacterium]|nr:glycoside hydrolase family 37 [Chthoniobacterales bacterium]